MELNWRKSTFSGDSGCVDVAASHGQVLVRDSKDPSGAVLHFNVEEWEAFLAGVHSGEFSLAQLTDAHDIE
jgi:hypothetical protein